MTTTPLNFFAQLKAKPGWETLREVLENCVSSTRAEPGNVNYDLHRNLDGQTVSAIYEGSTERNALGTHFFETRIAAGPLAIVTELSPTGA